MSEIRRVRLLALVISPQVVIDDGENLEPIQVNSMSFPAARLDDLPKLMREALNDLQVQLETQGDEEKLD